MHSRELPAFRTLSHAWPGVAREERDDHVVLALPVGERWVLDDPPDDVGAWQQRAGGAELWWEDRLSSTRPVVQGSAVRAVAAPPPAAEELHCFMHDAELDPGRPEGVRDLGDELDAAVALLAEAMPEALARWQLEAQLRAREDEWAAVLATGPVGAPTGVISVTWDGREARITGLAVHRDHRRTGLGRALLLGALQEWQGVAFGTAYAVTEPGSPAEALFRSVEMRPVTSVFRVARR
ncbi:MAG: GNAT family N-acetyltransferase [Alphaproteobacteria bacterium]|nr:GNAT family N-acetyltransferase [Alphaproteobacteria bacterium]